MGSVAWSLHRKPDAVELRRARAHLRRADPVLARLVRAVGPCRFAVVPGRPFAALAESIVYQQISGQAAAAVYRRFCEVCGRLPPRPADVLSASDEALRGAGLSRPKVAYLRDLATRVTGDLRLGALHRLDDEAVVEALTSVKGIGRWTAEMFLMFRLGRLDVLPVGDLAIRGSVRRTYRLQAPPSPAELRELAEPWRPYRTVACWYLWKAVDEPRARAAAGRRGRA